MAGDCRPGVWTVHIVVPARAAVLGRVWQRAWTVVTRTRRPQAHRAVTLLACGAHQRPGRRRRRSSRRLLPRPLRQRAQRRGPRLWLLFRTLTTCLMMRWRCGLPTTIGLLPAPVHPLCRWSGQICLRYRLLWLRLGKFPATSIWASRTRQAPLGTLPPEPSSVPRQTRRQRTGAHPRPGRRPAAALLRWGRARWGLWVKGLLQSPVWRLPTQWLRRRVLRWPRPRRRG